MQTRSLKVRASSDVVEARLSIESDASCGVLLAHGAGVGQHHGWMTTMRRLLANEGVPVMTFDYAYTAQGRKAPDRLERLLDVHRAAALRLGTYVERVVLAGKSMGGRVGSHLADSGAVPVAGLVYYGYPLVPMGKREPRPTDHLERIAVPQLFFAGTRDRLSPPELLEPMVKRLPRAELHVVTDADHSFRVPKRSSLSNEEVLERIAAATGVWLSAEVGDIAHQ